MSIFGPDLVVHSERSFSIRHCEAVIERVDDLSDEEVRRGIEMWGARCGRGWSGVADTSYLGLLIGEQHRRSHLRLAAAE